MSIQFTFQRGLGLAAAIAAGPALAQSPETDPSVLEEADPPALAATGPGAEAPAMQPPEALAAVEDPAAGANRMDDPEGPVMSEPDALAATGEEDYDAPLSVVEDAAEGEPGGLPTHRVVILEFTIDGVRPVASYDAVGPAPVSGAPTGDFAYVAEGEGGDPMASGSFLDPLIAYGSEEVEEGGEYERGHSVSRVTSAIVTVAAPEGMAALNLFRVPGTATRGEVLAPEGIARLGEAVPTVLALTAAEVAALPDAAEGAAPLEMRAPELQPGADPAE